MTTSAKPKTNLTHPKGCPANRVEFTEHPTVVTEHCLDCGSHWPPPPPGGVGPLATAATPPDDTMRASR